MPSEARNPKVSPFHFARPAPRLRPPSRGFGGAGTWPHFFGCLTPGGKKGGAGWSRVEETGGGWCSCAQRGHAASPCALKRVVCLQPGFPLLVLLLPCHPSSILSFCHTPASLSGCLKPQAVSWEGSILPSFLKGQCTILPRGRFYLDWKFSFKKNICVLPCFNTTCLLEGICVQRAAPPSPSFPFKLASNIQRNFRRCSVGIDANMHIS